MKVLIVHPDGAYELTQAPSDEDARLTWCQGVVGGFIEGISPSHNRLPVPWIAYGDEEGKLKRYPVNAYATVVARAAGWPISTDFLVGKVLFFGVKGSTEIDVPTQLVDLAVRLTERMKGAQS